MATFLSGPNLGPAQAAYLGNLEDFYGMGQARQGGGLNSLYGYGGSRGGGGGSSGYYGGAIPNDYQRAYEEARAANEQRYQDILTGYQNRSNEFQNRQSGNTDDVLTGYENRYQRGMDMLTGLGTQEKRDVDESYQKLGAANQQDMTNRGLTGTTIMPTMRAGIERERQDALSRVNERLQREQLMADAGLSGDALGAQERMYGQGLAGYMGATGDTLGFAERRNDTYPDLNQLMGLAQQYGASGAGYANPNDPGYSTTNLSDLGYNIPGMGGQGYGGMPQNHGMRNWVQPWARPQQQQGQQGQQQGAPFFNHNTGRWEQAPATAQPPNDWSSLMYDVNNLMVNPMTGMPYDMPNELASQLGNVDLNDVASQVLGMPGVPAWGQSDVPGIPRMQLNELPADWAVPGFRNDQQLQAALSEPAIPLGVERVERPPITALQRLMLSEAWKFLPWDRNPTMEAMVTNFPVSSLDMQPGFGSRRELGYLGPSQYDVRNQGTWWSPESLGLQLAAILGVQP